MRSGRRHCDNPRPRVQCHGETHLLKRGLLQPGQSPRCVRWWWRTGWRQGIWGRGSCCAYLGRELRGITPRLVRGRNLKPRMFLAVLGDDLQLVQCEQAAQGPVSALTIRLGAGRTGASLAADARLSDVFFACLEVDACARCDQIPGALDCSAEWQISAGSARSGTSWFFRASWNWATIIVCMLITPSPGRLCTCRGCFPLPRSRPCRGGAGR